MHEVFQAPSRQALDPALLDQEPLVVHKRSENTSNQALIVFVHGLGGNRYGEKATWGNFPDFVYEDFPELDVGLYSYRTLFGRLKFWKSVSLDNEAEIFAGIIRDAKNYKTVILAGHSMGGLLSMAAIRYLVVTNQADELLRLAGLVLMATPQLGSLSVPRFLSWFSKDARALRPHGNFIARIRETFDNFIVLDESIRAPGKVVVPTWALQAASDFWVDKLSAGIQLPASRKKLVRGSHTAIVKPQTKQTDAYRFVSECIKSCLSRNLEPVKALNTQRLIDELGYNYAELLEIKYATAPSLSDEVWRSVSGELSNIPEALRTQLDDVYMKIRSAKQIHRAIQAVPMGANTTPEQIKIETLLDNVRQAIPRVIDNLKGLGSVHPAGKRVLGRPFDVDAVNFPQTKIQEEKQ